MRHRTNEFFKFIIISLGLVGIIVDFFYNFL